MVDAALATATYDYRPGAVGEPAVSYVIPERRMLGLKST